MLRPIAVFLASTLLLFSCKQDELDTAALPGQTCGTEGARMSAHIGNDEWCANASVVAAGSNDGTVLISGLSLSGKNLMLQIDSVMTGTLPVDEINNSVAWMETGTTYTSTNTMPGTMTILSHDSGAHRLSGHIEVTVRNEDTAAEKTIEADFDVTYTLN